MPTDAPLNATAAIALEHMTGVARGTVTWLTGSPLNVTLDSGCFIQITPDISTPPEAIRVAHLDLVDGVYVVKSIPGTNLWVNGRLVVEQRLKHGDSIEFGESGPLCRLRVYSDLSRVRNSVPEILSDVFAYIRVSRQTPVRRVMSAGGALFGRLTYETSVLFRVTVLLAIVGFAMLAYQQHQLNKLLQRDLESFTTQLDSVATALVNTQKEALRAADLNTLRDSLEQRLTTNVSRLDELEHRSTATARVIAESAAQVVFLQGMYGFRERNGTRMLRQAVTDNGVPLMSFRGRPLLTLEGDGPQVELQFTGTGFFVGTQGDLITNRHVALPWEQSTGSVGPGFEGVEPVMLRFVGYLYDTPDPMPVALLRASEEADLAILRSQAGDRAQPGLVLASAPPRSGTEVLVMGYPTGLRSMLAQSGAAFIEQLQDDNLTDFWSVAKRLAEAGYISPLSSRGIVGQVTTSAIVYDAETTHGGSGGPVLDNQGRVVAVNSAILPEYGGSNLGVPASAVRALLDSVGASLD